MMLMLLDFLYLDGYRSLYDKYHDKSGLTRAEHDFCVIYRKQVESEMFRAFKFRKCLELKRAYKNNDWNTVYEILLEWMRLDPAEINEIL